MQLLTDIHEQKFIFKYRSHLMQMSNAKNATQTTSWILTCSVGMADTDLFCGHGG